MESDKNNKNKTMAPVTQVTRPGMTADVDLTPPLQ